jgi:hypothetical protein
MEHGSPIDEVDKVIRLFTDRLGLTDDIDVVFDRVGTFTSPQAKTAWSGKKGLYLFLNAGDVMYAGRAIGSTLGERVGSQCRSRGSAAWDEILDHPDTQIKVLIFPDDGSYWAAALEALLIGQFRFPINKRVS